MDKDLEKLSALYDGELSHKEMQEGIETMVSDEVFKRDFQEIWIAFRAGSETFRTKNPKVSFLKDYFRKLIQ